MLPRINCHVHVFPLKVATTEWALEVVQTRLRREVVEQLPDLLHEKGQDLVDGFVQDFFQAGSDLNERSLLEKVLESLGIEADLPDALEEPVLRSLRRQVDRAIERLRRHPPEEDALHHNDLHDLVETLRIAGQRTVGDVTDWLVRQLRAGDAFVPLTLDLTDGTSDVTDLPPGETPLFEEQLAQTSRQVLRYPGRVLPFVAVHPAREGDPNAEEPEFLRRMKDALESRGFVGVKLYPSLGFDTDDDEMDAVYEYCEENGIPLIVHTNKSGFVGPQQGDNLRPDPKTWRDDILQRFPDLLVDFAHLGGSGSMVAPFDPADPLRIPRNEPADENWAQILVEMARDHAGAHVDISFHSSAMEGPEAEDTYFPRLKAFLAHPDVGDKILFGTDFWLIRPRLRESSHWRFFENRLSADEFERIAVANSVRFLGLDPAGRVKPNAAVKHYVDFVVRHQDRLESVPAEWLLQAIADDGDHGPAVRDALVEATERKETHRRILGNAWQELVDAVGNLTVADDFGRTFDVATDKITTDVLGLPVGIEAGAELELRTFHDADQHDVDGLLLPPPGGSGLGNFERTRIERVIGTQIPFTEELAWTKSRFVGRLGASAESVGLDSLAKVAASAEKEVILTDYRVHERDEPLLGALVRQLRRPRFALSRDDVIRLAPGDAVSFATRGSLEGEITLSWSDVFTSGLDRLARILGTSAPIRLRTAVGASLTARVRVEDDFRVSFARNGERIRVAVRKIESRETGVQAGVVAAVEFDDPAALQDAIDQLLAQGELGQPGEVRDELRGEIRDAVEEIVRARVRIGFDYHYRRLETHAVLLEADLTEGIVEEIHHELVDGDLSGLLFRWRRGDVERIDLHQYLRFKEIVKRRSWGFHLGPVGGREAVETRFREHRSRDGERQLAFLGLRDFRQTWPSIDGRGDFELATWHWEVDLRAEMDHFARVPRLGDLDYGLGFEVHWESRLFKHDLEQWIDFARTWRVLPPEADVDAVWPAVEDHRGQPVFARLQTVFGHDVLGAVVAQALDAGAGELGTALGAAMPHGRDNARESPEARIRSYGPLWRSFLEEEAFLDDEDEHRVRRLARLGRRRRAVKWGRIAERSLRQAGFRAAANHERFGFDANNNNAWRRWTLGGTLFVDGSPADELRRFRDGLRRLAPAWDDEQEAGHEAEERLPQIFDGLQSFWDQTHYLRAAGRLLVDAAARAGQLGEVESSLTIRSEDEEEEIVIGIPG